MKVLQEKLDFLLDKYSVGKKAVLKDKSTVTVDGKLFETYSLNEDKTVEIRTGENGENSNLLVIENGRAFVKTATCPDGICASHKPIFRDGESIVCLPHRVVITADSVDLNQPDIIV